MNRTADRRGGHFGGRMLLLLVLGLSPVAAAGQTAGQRTVAEADLAFLNLWRQHGGQPDMHGRHAADWFALATRYAEVEGHAAVARSLAAWHYLKAGEIDEAREIYVALASQDRASGLARSAREIARGWLTCLDREELVLALDRYRRDALRYPVRLDAIQGGAESDGRGRFRLVDRWDQPWSYQLVRLRSLPMLEGQRYELESRSLGARSALHVALSDSLGASITLRPVQIRSVPNRPPLVALAVEGEGGAPALIQAGGQHAGVWVGYVSPRIVILHDRLQWKFFPSPTP